MDYRVFRDTIVLRLDPNDEIINGIVEVCKREKVKLGYFTGIGAVREIEAGLFDPDEQIYIKKEYFGKYEMASITGNITTHEKTPYIHMHGVWADVEGTSFGGHISRAVVSVAGEIFINKINAQAGRRLNPDIGFNQMIFSLPEEI